MAASPIIEAIREKLEKILSQNKHLQNENAKVKGANEKLKEQNIMLKDKLIETQKKLSLMELSKGFSAGGADNKQAQMRVNQLLREVDNCIKILNGQ